MMDFLDFLWTFSRYQSMTQLWVIENSIIYLHDPDIVGSVDLRILGKFLTQRGHALLKMFALSAILSLYVSIDTGRLNL